MLKKPESIDVDAEESRLDIDECKPVATPIKKDCKNLMPKALTFHTDKLSVPLLYLLVRTRPDIIYNVGFLSRSLENPFAEDIV
ncbi:hypothetical protein NPIL_189051 [Nephila pilipes]|uniref:Uncharacterized protein n=1 Tax=Nephila pilipes TaxID=299642 RepID=A0A8X6IZF6_NEPPI|nr:hypothetical protein NPIL_189051 [Nephila pilipes]